MPAACSRAFHTSSSLRHDVANYLSQDEYFDESETASFYIRHMPKQALRSTDPIHEYFTAPSERRIPR